MVCPWIGCGGTIRKTSIEAQYGQGWVCNTCGEFFASPEDYQAKLKKENEWAEAWITWSEEKMQEEVEAKPPEAQTFVVEEQTEETSVQEDAGEISLAH